MYVDQKIYLRAGIVSGGLQVNNELLKADVRLNACFYLSKRITPKFGLMQKNGNKQLTHAEKANALSTEKALRWLS